jgi:hypothetical protein
MSIFGTFDLPDMFILIYAKGGNFKMKTYTKEFKADALAYIASHPDIPIQNVADSVILIFLLQHL